jgi:PPK2 family polyphosphate:nucleotide phosphotransferase
MPRERSPKPPKPSKLSADVAVHRHTPGKKVHLAERDAAATPAFRGSKKDAQPLLQALNRRLEELQEIFWAEGRRKVLVILQGLDTSGKDGVVRRVFEGANPSGVRVVSFKAPSAEELARDFLWRAHRGVPAAGEIAIFNRSHYEDVLVVRVRGLAPESVWRRRYRQIVDFENLLAETGTTVVKFFLHISKDEQKLRLEDRLADPTKRWKFRRGDLEDRALWEEYRAAYREAIERTGTESAPWWIVPADRNWYRDLVISQVLVTTLETLDPRLPPGEADLAKVKID